MPIRDPSPAALACLALAFAMLWVPVGQHAFLLLGWMKLGTFMAPFLVFAALAFRGRGAAESVRLMALGLLIAYIAHQFEEHWIDLYGEIYAFRGSVNALLLEALGADPGAEGPLTDAAVFVINTALVWLVAALAIWAGPAHVFPTLAMAGIVLVNAVSHIAAGLSAGAYNPGLLTAVVLFLPAAAFVYWRLLADGRARGAGVALSLAWAVLAHAIMIAGIIAANWLKIVPEAAYFLALVLWSILPSVPALRQSLRPGTANPPA
ncbi:MAG: HXXEE domain-containing protein [Pseudomonadota bacterium]